MDHFAGITPQERYNNDLLATMKRIADLLENSVPKANEPVVLREKAIQTPKRSYQRRGAK